MPDVASSPYRFGDLLALARRSWIRQVRAAVEKAGFDGYRQSDSIVLRLLAQRPLAIGQLGDGIGVTRQAARKVADAMVDRGYAEFEADPDDARRTLVVLTKYGRSYARAVARTQNALNAQMSERVSRDDLKAADSVLRAVFPTAESRRRLDAVAPPQ
ncbi:MAG: MarR family transcriptional regulator [Acidimicrobiales bacterium]|jgi:DNA-binding MarR family transcriptional regulator